MNTNNDGWIKMTERKPTEADLPVWGINATNGKEPFLCLREDWHEMAPGRTNSCSGFNNWATHWKPAVLPAPPAKELTQAERDGEAFTRFLQLLASTKLLDSAVRQEAWHAALAHRDAQNREDLKALQGAPSFSREREILSELRRRCGLDT